MRMCEYIIVYIDIDVDTISCIYIYIRIRNINIGLDRHFNIGRYRYRYIEYVFALYCTNDDGNLQKTVSIWCNSSMKDRARFKVWSLLLFNVCAIDWRHPRPACQSSAVGTEVLGIKPFMPHIRFFQFASFS